MKFFTRLKTQRIFRLLMELLSACGDIIIDALIAYIFNINLLLVIVTDVIITVTIISVDRYILKRKYTAVRA